MKCNNWTLFGILMPGTAPGNAGPGWTAYARYCGYSFANAGEYAELDSYEDIMNSINQENPPMILFMLGTEYTDWHWCVIKGYVQGEETDFIVIEDPWCFNTTLNWETHYSISYLTYIFPGNYAALDGHVSFPGRGTPPDDRWIEELEVRFFDSASQQEMRWSPVSATTSRYGYFYLGNVPPGTYNISIKNWTCLSELETGVVLPGGGGAYVDFGTTREGDCNHTGISEDRVNSNDYIDILVNYGNVYPNGDFDRDGKVDFDDYVTVLVNYGQKGDLL